MENNFHIRQLLTPSVSQLDYGFAELNLFDKLAKDYADLLPIKWRSQGEAILLRSRFYREWFTRITAINNAHIETMIRQNGIKASLTAWRDWQELYIEENKFRPHKVVLQVAVKEWQHRVSQQKETADLQTAGCH
jgi:hypothetical protein